MPVFQIDTYKVSSYLERFSGETRPTRVLELIGPVQYHGIQNRASFAFSSFFNGVWDEPVSGYLTDGGYDGLYVAGWFPLSEYSYYYNIVRSEKPIHVLYEFRDSGATAGYLRKVGLGTSTEEIGEGPSDTELELSNAGLQHIASAIKHLVPMPTTTVMAKER